MQPEYENIQLEMDGEVFSLATLIRDNNEDGMEVISADDISRILALPEGGSTHLENSHTGSTLVTRLSSAQ